MLATKLLDKQKSVLKIVRKEMIEKIPEVFVIFTQTSHSWQIRY
jgi:hypothetical protein